MTIFRMLMHLLGNVCYVHGKDDKHVIVGNLIYNTIHNTFAVTDTGEYVSTTIYFKITDVEMIRIGSSNTVHIDTTIVIPD